MELHVLGSKSYGDNTTNYGDCFLVIDGQKAIVYDCGSEEHAKRVIEKLDTAGVKKATVFLSHNDDDHFKGIPYLIEQGRVEKLFTVLLLKYKQELLNKIGDGRRDTDSIGEAITEKYDNIASLSGKVALRDVYEDVAEIPSSVKFIGPDFDYMLDVAAKGLDKREGDTVDLETVTNASSIQIQVKLGQDKTLLTGDCAPEAIPSSEPIETYKYIQLPHHGKAELADKIFDRTYSHNNIVFLVSDNTGNSNGGSQKLKSKGHDVRNTKDGGDYKFTGETQYSTYRGSLGI